MTEHSPGRRNFLLKAAAAGTLTVIGSRLGRRTHLTQTLGSFHSHKFIVILQIDDEPLDIDLFLRIAFSSCKDGSEKCEYPDKGKDK